MITKEAIESGCAAIDRPIHPDDVERILTAALAAMPGPAVNADDRLYNAAAPMADGGDTRMTAAEEVLAWLLVEKIGVPDDVSYSPDQAQQIIVNRLESISAPTPAPDLASENERLRDELLSAACLFETLSDDLPNDDVSAIMMRVMAERIRAALERT